MGRRFTGNAKEYRRVSCVGCRTSWVLTEFQAPRSHRCADGKVRDIREHTKPRRAFIELAELWERVWSPK